MDFSNAPEGATHYRIFEDSDAAYYRVSNVVEGWTSKNKWVSCFDQYNKKVWLEKLTPIPAQTYVPVAGEECEFRNKIDPGQWLKMTPNYVGSEMVVFNMPDGFETATHRSLTEFRPLRTVVAERERQINAIREVILDHIDIDSDSTLKAATDLHDKGYRLQDGE